MSIKAQQWNHAKEMLYTWLEQHYMPEVIYETLV